ncbi:glyoxalase [Mesohalobacter halotolerans]|uniref:Glyoxalase n=1 Tax=Mesohalobacter halotolerans TaxID=1883405 RepID=A0A4V6ALG6_9FLAO|nr:glyoxalase [Mesohalobacter halotolerans]MBS3737781.1 glyoxalase [Psychroflexus sp.]TKS56525.1 glyoxalase [Mesohalobacter halotolerans]
MENRSQQLSELRPVISGAKVTALTSEEESFQNKTLRPIAKLQNDLLLEIFKHYIKKRKNVYFTLSLQKQVDYIEHAVKQDTKLRNTIKGVFIGLFTYDEYLIYAENNRALNKRITNLTIERLKNHMQYFEEAYAS